MKLIVLYKQPADTEAFDKAYFETHLPLVNKVPGIRKTALHRVTRTLTGDGYYLVAEMAFDDEASLKTAMRSPEMAAAGANLQTFAAGLATMMYAAEIEA